MHASLPPGPRYGGTGRVHTCIFTSGNYIPTWYIHSTLIFFHSGFHNTGGAQGAAGGGGIFNFPINLVGYFSQVPSMLVGSSQCCGRSHRFSLMRWEVG